MARRLDSLTRFDAHHAMRPLAVLTLLLLAGPLSAKTLPDLAAALAAKDDSERYRLALAELRTTGNPALLATHRDLRIAEAAIDAARERLADLAEPPPAEAEVIAFTLLGYAGGKESNPDLAMRAIHAVAESHCPFGGRVSEAVAKLALDPACAIRVDAIAALGDLGDGRQAAALAKLAGDADAKVAEAARDGLVSIQGKGVTDTFVRGIADASLGDPARIALLQAASKRGMIAAAPAAAQALSEPPLRLEAQKAVLKLARKAHLPELRAAREKLADAAATRAALDRLIARLEKE